MKKVVLKHDLHDDKEKQKALMKAVSGLSGIDSIAMDMKERKLTVTGNIDPNDVVNKLRKGNWQAEILSVGPAKEEKKDDKKDGGGAKKDDDKKKEDDKKKQVKQQLFFFFWSTMTKQQLADLERAYQNYNPQMTRALGRTSKNANEIPSSKTQTHQGSDDASRKTTAIELPRCFEENVAGNVVHVAGIEKDEILQTLRLHSSLFPEGHEFRKHDLVQLWIAEGFIKERQEEHMEDIGLSYFNSLEDEGFFVRSRYDFRVDFDSDFSVSNTPNSLYKISSNKVVVSGNISSQADYFRAVDAKLDGAATTTQHLSLICKGIDEMTFEVVDKLKKLRTLLLLPDDSGTAGSITHVPRNLFWSLELLRTLVLSGTLISELPSSIRNAKELRYLDVSYTPITRLPEPIVTVQNLQTLKLRGCVNFDQLPEGMKKLTRLRHIELDIMRQLDSLPPHLGNLINLQTLAAFIVGKKAGCGIGELKNLNDLKGSLCLSRLENVSGMKEAKEAALIDKKYLHRLELRWSYPVMSSKKEEQEEILECLQPYRGLKELKIQNYGGSKLSTWISNPSFADLVSIRLYRCKNCILLPSIGRLPALKVLSITEMNEVKEINHQFFRDGLVGDEAFHAFPKLERLEVDMMLNLKEWKEVKEGDFPSLIKLTVDSCPELITLPSFSSLNSLVYLEFRRCPKLQTSDGLPDSLESLIIKDCPQIKESFRKGDGDPRILFI